MFWEKDWGSITQWSYCEHVVPLVGQYISQHPELQFQQDNASGHAAAYTRLQLSQHGIIPIFWPANSPDLNPIESLWNWMKDWIDDYDPTVHRNYRRLRATVQAAWDAVPHEKIVDLVKSMPERC